jgi:hypothetical protein
MTRPDYCPVSQEPCQAMCVLSDVRCKIRDTAPQPAQQPLTDEKLFELLRSVDAGAVRVAPGLRKFASAIEAAHGITGEKK